MQTRHAAPRREFSSYTEFYSTSAYEAFPQEHRSGGSFGLGMMKVDQEPIDFIDAAVPDLAFARTEDDLGSVLLDVGDGKQTSPGLSGSIAYFPANTEARVRVEVPHQIKILALRHDSVAELMLDTGCSVSGFDRYASKMTRRAAASSIMDRMWQASSNSSPANHLYLDGLTLQFLSVMADGAALSPFGSDYVEDQRIARAIDYLDAHIGDALTVAELAGIAALSPSQFARVFKATTGEAVWAFVQRRRIERARDMLRHTATPISQIAFECGFASQNHMTSLFRRHLGVTPGSFRANT